MIELPALKINGKRKGENATWCPARSLLLTYKKRYKHNMCVAPDPSSGDHMGRDSVHYTDVNTDLFTWTVLNEPLISSSQFSLTHFIGTIQKTTPLHSHAQRNANSWILKESPGLSW